MMRGDCVTILHKKSSGYFRCSDWLNFRMEQLYSEIFYEIGSSCLAFYSEWHLVEKSETLLIGAQRSAGCLYYKTVLMFTSQVYQAHLRRVCDGGKFLLYSMPGAST